MRSTMAAALEAGEIRVTAQAGTAAVALSACVPGEVQAALIDLDLGRGPTGIDLAAALRARDPSIGLVLLTSYDDPRLLDDGLPEPPAGTVYLRKQQVSSIQEVLDALTAVCRRPVGPAISQRREHGLTGAQLAILRDLAKGMTNGQIAADRGITVSAVEKSIRRIAAALAVSTDDGNLRVQLTQCYLRMAGKDAGRG